MDKTLQFTVRNSDLKITKEKRAFLTYPADGLANCSLEELEDGISLTFETEGLGQSKEVRSKAKEQKLRFLINCADLEILYEEYDFSLSTDNLLVDINLRPQVLLRDVKNSRAGSGVGNGAASGINKASNNGTGSKVDDGAGNDNGNTNGAGSTNINIQRFLPKYMALIGSFLLRKYDYEDFEKGGADLCKKDKLLLELSKLESTADIKLRLIKEYHKTVNKIEQTKHLVPKRNAIIARIAIPILTLSLIATGFFAGMALLFDIPYRNQVILANEAYIAGNPLDVQRALSEFPVQNLTHETKHILSRSYVATEPLSDAQRVNLLMGLTLITDTSIFDYWIHLGRLEFYEAIDIAQRFGDSELLLFAFLRQEAIVRADPHMPGSEKVALLSYIENRIDALQRNRENAEEFMANAADETGQEDESLDDAGYPYSPENYYEYGYEDDAVNQDEDDEGAYNQGEDGEDSDND